MFGIRPNAASTGFDYSQADEVPGFRVGQLDQVPGLHNFKPPQVPGFHVNSDDSARSGYPTAGEPPLLHPVQWAAEPAGYSNALSVSQKPVTLGDLAAKVANRIGTHANAVVNGAYSVFPGVYDAGRAVARGTGLLGQEEFRRFGQEADFVGGSLGKIAEHPEASARIARRAWPPAWADGPRGLRTGRPGHAEYSPAP